MRSQSPVPSRRGAGPPGRSPGGRGRTAARRLALALAGTTIPAFPVAAQEAGPGPLCGAGIHAGEDVGLVTFPTGDIFCPLLADPKAEASFMTLARGDFPTLTERENETEIGSVGLADAFPLVRWNGSTPGDGVQLSLSGGVFAQFDLRSASFDLINADYVVGLPVTIRSGHFSLRIRPYHQSSHLGDEYLLRDGPVERENLSFESLEVIASQEMGGFRVYGGGEYLFRREPEALEDLLVHGGAELRLGRADGRRLVFALDAKSTEEQEWEPALSARAGVELAIGREPGHPPRLWSVLVEVYDGPSPYGQFYQEQIRYYGLGLRFAL